MTERIVLTPKAAAASVCHDEQLTIWASDFVGMLSVGGYLRDDLDYSDGVDLDHAVRRELRSIIEMAFTHPEVIALRALKDSR